MKLNDYKNSEKKINAREIALKIIHQVETEGAYANILLARQINKENLNDQDRRFITELVYGTVKAGQTLDWILEHYLSRPLAKIAPIIRSILRLGAYQIFFLSKVPPSAACNEAVEMTKKYGHAGTVKFVNGVLRNAARNKEKSAFPPKETDPAGHIALKYCHPLWLVKRWAARLGADECERLCQLNNTSPPLSLRTNTLKTDRSRLIGILDRENVSAEMSLWTPEGIICREYPALGALDSLKEGLFQIQDEASMLVAHVLTPQPGEFIIDACGAPGGKSSHIAALMANKGRVFSADIHAHKLALTEENAARLGISIIEAKIQDAVEMNRIFAGQADRVLVDAPCSGLGVLRRKPDARWRKSEDILAVAALPKLQMAILTSCADCVKPGGTLVYSTCTTEPEENGEIIKAFLASRPDYSLDNTGLYLPEEKREEKMLQFWPQRDSIDGFFMTRMTRK